MQLQAKGYNLTLSINNFNVSYNDIGEGNIPILFLHGFPFDKSTWNAQLEFLKFQHRVIAYDVRGFGKSTDEESHLSINMFADDLIAFMDALKINQAIICGLSMGGYIALNALKRFPDRFVSVILCDTQCVADTPDAKEKRYKAIEEIKEKGPKKFNDGFINKVFYKETINNKPEIVEGLRKIVFNNTQHIITTGLTALAERDETCTSLNEINIPTLIICGREDEVTGLEQSTYMHENIKNSILCVIDNAGHVSNLEEPNEFNKHLLSFITSHTPTAI